MYTRMAGLVQSASHCESALLVSCFLVFRAYLYLYLYPLSSWFWPFFVMGTLRNPAPSPKVWLNSPRPY